FGKPFAVAGHDLAAGLTVVYAAGAVIHWLGAVVSLPLVADLRFVAAPELPGDSAEKHAAIEMLAVGKDVELEHEVVPLPLGLQVAVAVLDVQLALVVDGELRLVAGDFLPAGQVLAVEDGFEASRLVLQIT